MMLGNKIRIIQHKQELHRLAFVKYLKEITNLGLKDAKDLADQLHVQTNGLWNNSIEVNYYPKVLDEFKHNLKGCTGEYTVVNTQEWDREIKLLSIGLGSDFEYVELIAKEVSKHDSQYIENFIITILSELERTKLETIFKNHFNE